MFILKNAERDADQVGNLRYKFIGAVFVGNLFSVVFDTILIERRVIHNTYLKNRWGVRCEPISKIMYNKGPVDKGSENVRSMVE